MSSPLYAWLHLQERLFCKILEARAGEPKLKKTCEHKLSEIRVKDALKSH